MLKLGQKKRSDSLLPEHFTKTKVNYNCFSLMRLRALPALNHSI